MLPLNLADITATYIRNLIDSEVAESVTPTRCSAEFADYLLKIAARYPAADTIHLDHGGKLSEEVSEQVLRNGANDGFWGPGGDPAGQARSFGMETDAKKIGS